MRIVLPLNYDKLLDKLLEIKVVFENENINLESDDDNCDENNEKKLNKDDNVNNK